MKQSNLDTSPKTILEPEMVLSPNRKKIGNPGGMERPSTREYGQYFTTEMILEIIERIKKL